MASSKNTKIPQFPSLAESIDMVRSKEVSPVDLVAMCLERIESGDAEINAFAAVFAEQALSQAKEAERAIARKEPVGALHGVPIALKDLLYTKGVRTSRGSKVFQDFVPDKDAPIVERLISAGAITVGKTTTTEFGWTASSVSSLFGPTRNPWDKRLTSGGSSSGSAAAVSARMVPAAIGSDGGGSVRVPASFCGIYSMKGTLGRIPVWPWSATETLSHAGPMTVSVKDSALLFDVLKGPHALDHGCLPDDGLSYAKEIERPTEGARVAYIPSLFGAVVDPQVEARVKEAVRTIEHDLNCSVDELDLDWADPFTAFETIWVGGRGIAYGDLVKDRREDLDPGFRFLVEQAQKIGAKDFIAALKSRALFSNLVQGLFEVYDFLVMPSVPIAPFSAELNGPDTGPYIESKSPVAWARWAPFSYPFNLTGNPAASLPCGWNGNLPVGLQVVGRRFDDAGVLRFSATFEAARPWRNRVPPMSGHENKK